MVQRDCICFQTTIDDEYGGMPAVIYDAIVRYKKKGSYPSFSDQRMDRSAHAHWRYSVASSLRKH